MNTLLDNWETIAPFAAWGAFLASGILFAAKFVLFFAEKRADGDWTFWKGLGRVLEVVASGALFASVSGAIYAVLTL